MCVSTVCACVAVGKRVERHSLCPVFTSLDFKHPTGSQDCFSHYSTCDSHYTQHIVHYTHTYSHTASYKPTHLYSHAQSAHAWLHNTNIHRICTQTHASFRTVPLALFKAHIQSFFNHGVLYITALCLTVSFVMTLNFVP